MPGFGIGFADENTCNQTRASAPAKNGGLQAQASRANEGFIVPTGDGPSARGWGAGGGKSQRSLA